MYVLYIVRTFTPFKEKRSDHLKDFQKIKVVTNFNVNLTTYLGEEAITVLNFWLTTPPGDEVALAAFSGASVYEDVENDRRIFL